MNFFCFFRTWCKTEQNINKKDSELREIKIEKDFIGGYEFKGSVVSISHNSEFITSINSNLQDKLKEKHFSCKVCNKAFSTSYKFQVHKNYVVLHNSYVIPVIQNLTQKHL